MAHNEFKFGEVVTDVIDQFDPLRLHRYPGAGYTHINEDWQVQIAAHAIDEPQAFIIDRHLGVTATGKAAYRFNTKLGMCPADGADGAHAAIGVNREVKNESIWVVSLCCGSGLGALKITNHSDINAVLIHFLDQECNVIIGLFKLWDVLEQVLRRHFKLLNTFFVLEQGQEAVIPLLVSFAHRDGLFTAALPVGWCSVAGQVPVLSYVC